MSSNSKKFIASEYSKHIFDNNCNVISEDKLNSLKNNEGIVGLYFSAHWCGPCKNFTPKLVEKYREILSHNDNSNTFEIIFVSADGSEADALNYFKDMPWLMIDYNARDVEEELSKKFEIEGIPSLLLFNTADGSLLTNDGRDALFAIDHLSVSKLQAYLLEKKTAEEEKQKELEEMKAVFKPCDYFASTDLIVKKDKEVEFVTLEPDQLKGKIVGLYFSAHWCPPCRGFTPLLAEKYKSIIETHPNSFEIVFISSDRDMESAKKYFHDMPWVMLKFEERSKKALLSELFEVQGIPTLVLIDGQNGSIITTDGREAIMTTPFTELRNFEEYKKMQLEKLNHEMHSDKYPDNITVTCHEHALVKLPNVYRGSYGCDICSQGGHDWVYHCEDCGFDAHPQCAVSNIVTSSDSDVTTN